MGGIRRLMAADAEAYRAIRLQGLSERPEAFGASWEEERIQHLSWFAERLASSVVFGSWSTDESLDGVVGMFVPAGVKQAHKGVVWGMFVRSQMQGRGLGAALLQAVIDHVGNQVAHLLLTVVATNAAAIRIYERAGFRQYGIEPAALKIGEDRYDEVLMVRSVTGSEPVKG